MKNSICVLASGGLDSCALVAAMAQRYRQVYPVFVRQGLRWEVAELRALRRFLKAAHLPAPTVLDLPVRDLYGAHWSVTGKGVPGARTRDAAVYLPGRNLLLLSKAAVFCAQNEIGTIAIGSLGHNPFADATPKFFREFGRLTGVRVIAPFRQLAKAQVLRRYRHLPLHLTFSCLAPRRGRPCGCCNKCAERQRAFQSVFGKPLVHGNCSREPARGTAKTGPTQPTREQARGYKGTSETRSQSAAQKR